MQNIPDLFREMIEFGARANELKASKAPSSVFQKLGEEQAFQTFQFASNNIPAYKDFLKKNKIDPKKIKTFKDLEKVPLTNKKNYLKKYPLKDLLTGGSFIGKSAITSSSGSSGETFFWPRTPMQDFGATKGFDSYLVNTFNIDKISTLHLNCSGMGVWTAGDYVGLLNKYLSYKYSNNSSMCPGIDLDNTIRVLQKISPNFEQTIIYSYPPFAKDIIDNMPPKLIKKLNLKLVVYGEPYTEKWRQYILQKIDGSQNKPYFVSSVLGSSEGGLIGSETKVCTLVRILSSKNKKLCNSLFGDSRVPSLIQFNPMAKFIEIVGGNIVLTNMGGLPLIRYDTCDSGSLLNKEKIITSCERFCNKDFHKELEKMDALMTSMPYLYVFGRSDYSASVYGVLIYPETIKDILSTKPFSNFLSGRFVMSTEEDKDSNQFLNIILETKKKVDIKDVAIAAIERLFADHLQLYSSEYAKLVSAMGQRVYPRIEIKNYGESEYFSSNNKHKYLM